jgi:uncharacterized protein YcbX
VQVLQLWRYPVKSLQGELLDASDVDAHGLAGDRRWALLDTRTGMTLTARRQPELLHASGRLVGDGVEVVLPDGTATTDDAVLSDWLGHPVSLVAAGEVEHHRYETPLDAEHEEREWATWEGPSATFHDSGRTHVSIVSTAAVRQWDVRRFRPNVVVDGRDEEALVGTTVGAGTVVLDVVKRIDRCVVVTRPQPGGIERDLDVLRTISREQDLCLAVGALVATPGRIAVGDALS